MSNEFQKVKLGPFKAGWIFNVQKADFPENAVSDGHDVDLETGEVRGGCSLVSHATASGLPEGEIRLIKNVRFPSNESSYTVVQVRAQMQIYVGSHSSARSEHTAVWDSSRKRMLVFGGYYRVLNEGTGYYDDVLLNDILAYNPATHAWTIITPTGTPPTARYSHVAVYDVTGDRMVVHGGQDVGGRKADVWSYNCAANTWTELTTTGDVPSARMEHAAVYNPTLRTMIVSGGKIGSSSWAEGTTLCTLNLASLVWADHAKSGAVPASTMRIMRHTLAFDDTNQKLYLWGGLIDNEVEPTDVWSCSISTYVWAQLADWPNPVDPTVGPVEASGIFYDGKIFSLYGHIPGYTDPVTTIYDITTDLWTAPTIVGDIPLSRRGQTAVLTDTLDVVVFGGEGGDDPSGLVQDDTLIIPAMWVVGGITDKLYASKDHLPSTTATFTEIYDLGDTADVVSCAVLNDRAVLTEGKADVPVVWGGPMETDGSDWMYPKNVLVSQDGINFYDISSKVLDNDPDSVAEVGGIKSAGYFAICLDVPKVEALYVEVKTPNVVAGSGADQHIVTDVVALDSAAKFVQSDAKGTITTWVQDTPGAWSSSSVNYIIGDTVTYSAAKYRCILAHTSDAGKAPTNGTYWVAVTYTAGTVGHFTDGASAVTLGTGNTAPDVTAGCLVTIAGNDLDIVGIAGNGTGTGAVTLSDVQVGGTVTKINGLAIDPTINGLSLLSPTVTAMSDTFTAGATTPTTAPFGTYYNLVFRQKINPSASGSTVRVSFSARPAQVVNEQYANGFYVGAAYIVEAGTGSAGAATPTRLLFSGANAGYVVANSTTTTDTLTYAIDAAKDYFIIAQIYGALTPWQNGTRYPFAIPLYSGIGSGYYWIGAPENTAIPDSYVGQTPPADMRDATSATVGYDTCICVSKVEVSGAQVRPTGSYAWEGAAAIQDVIQSADSFNGVTVDTNSTVRQYLAASVDGRTSYQVYKSSAWRKITRNNSGTYEYNTSATTTATWVSASPNSMAGALRSAFGVSYNQLTPTDFNAITAAQWQESNGFIIGVSNTIDFAGMLYGGGTTPELQSLSVSYTDLGSTSTEGWTSAGWSAGDGWTDGTVVDGGSLGKSGIISYDGASPFQIEYSDLSDVPGFWLKFKTNGTSSGCSISQIKYKAPCQPLANIGNGQPDLPGAFVIERGDTGSVIDLGDKVADFADSFDSTIVLDLDTTDHFWVHSPDQYNAITIEMKVSNLVASVLSAAYWNGEALTALAITDGTDFEGKTLSQSGKVSWTLPTDWKMNIPFNQFMSRGYWIRFTVSVALTATTAISECRLYAVPLPLVKHKFASVIDNRVVLAGRPDAPDRVDISRQWEEYGFCGDNFYWSRLGGQDGISSIVEAWDGLLIGKTETLVNMKANASAGFAVTTIEAGRVVPVNSRVIVKAPVTSGESFKYGLYYLAQKGVYRCTGLQAESVFDTSQNQHISGGVLDALWSEDTSVYPRLDTKNLHIACGEYWPARSLVLFSVPMIVTQGQTEQTTNNRILAYNVKLGIWYPPYEITAASLCVAYSYSANASGKIGYPILLGGDYQGRVFRLFTPGSYTDFGTAIEAQIVTGYLNHQRLDDDKLLHAIRVFGESKTIQTGTTPYPIAVTMDSVKVIHEVNETATVGPYNFGNLNSAPGVNVQHLSLPGEFGGDLLRYTIDLVGEARLDSLIVYLNKIWDDTK
jgi:hypothetical protein